MRILLVGAGGFVGSILRYLLGGWIQARVAGPFPLGTVIVNLLGCLAIGLIAGLIDARQVLGPDGRAFLMVGVLGGFTTMSAFALETTDAVRGGAWTAASVNVVATVVLGIGAVFVGRGMAQWIAR